MLASGEDAHIVSFEVGQLQRSGNKLRNGALAAARGASDEPDMSILGGRLMLIVLLGRAIYHAITGHSFDGGRGI